MTTVAGMFETRREAEDAIHRLQAAGFSRDTIGIAMRDATESGDLADATGSNDLSAEGATSGLISGAAVGALVGIALVGSTVLLPGIGTVLIGGPIAAALTGAGIGAASGGLVGGLVGAGIPEHEATDYKSRIEAGHILVSVQANNAEVARARQILVEEGARTA
jgi:Heat induced stress protein YflT